VSVRDRDNGAKAFRERLAELAERGPIKLTVGVHADTGAAKHPSGGTVGEVASILEMGTDTKAPKGFLRNTIDSQRGAIAEGLAAAGRAVLEGAEIEPAFTPFVKGLVTDIQSRVPVDTATVREAVEGRIDGARVA
jgi:hypothetical protein